MTSLELKTRIHEHIEHLNDAQLKKLNQMLEQEFQNDLPKTDKQKKRQLGVMKGKIRRSDDWDSGEVNEEIARLFNDGSVFPEEDS